MKSYTIIAITVLAIAFAGIMYTGGEANAISYTAVAPLAAFTFLLLFNAVRNFFTNHNNPV
jgi:hypothetical protein